jgi:hypothetical protein
MSFFKNPIKIPIFKIPITRKRPDIERSIRNEFCRERTLKTLENIKNYLACSLPSAPEFDKVKIAPLLDEVERLIDYLNS